MKKSIFLFFAAILCSVSSWAANVGFESSGNTMKYYSNLKSSDQTVNLDRTNGTTTTLGSVTALYLKGFACKMYQDADNTIYGGNNQHAYYKVHRTAVTAGTSGYTDVTGWDWDWKSWSNGYRYPTGSKSLDVNLLFGLGSGKYSMTYYFQQKGSSTWRLPSNTSKYNVLKWTIDAPLVTSASCTSNGTGLGTEESPFMIPVGETLTLTVDGEQSFSDANSVLNVKFGDNEYSSTVTYTLTPTTTKQSITIKVKYYNSTDDLSGTEETLNVYFEALEEETNDVIVSYLCNSNPIAGHGNQTVAVGVTTPSGIKAPAITGYTFSSWDLGSGVQSADATTNPINITTKSGETDYTLVANYNEDLTSGWVLKGSFVDDFATAYDFTKKSGESTGKVAYTTIELVANTEYHFKVVNGNTNTWYGNNNYNEGNEEHWIKQTVENWDFYDDANDCYMKSGVAGTYTFKIDYSGTHPTVSVIYPKVATVTLEDAGDLGATLTGAGEYTESSSVTVTASHTDPDWVFAYWKHQDGEIASYDAEYTFTLGAEDVVLEAYFAMGGMESNMNDLVIDTDTDADTYMAVLIGSDASNGIEAMLAVSENIAGDLYRLAAAEVSFGGSSLDFVSGTVTIDMDAYTAIADVIVSLGGELMAIRMNMSATAAPVDVMVADATVTYSDNDGALRFNGTDAYSSDAVYVELSGFEYNGVGSNTLSVAQISMFENSTAFAFADEVVVTIESDGTVSVEGTYTSWADGSVYNVFIFGALPTYNLTLASNVDDATLTGAGTYYPTQEVTVTATEELTGWLFENWTNEEDEVVSTDATYTFRIGYDLELVANYTATTTPTTPDYTRATTAGKFGTICLPFGSTDYTGMELYECVGQETGKVYIASVTKLEAGVPYIFLATGTELVVYSDGTTAATPGDHNGLHGTFDDNTVVEAGNYILLNNELCQAETTCWVNANRAYLVMNEVPDGAPQQMPGRKYIGMSTKGENATTGLDNITNGENITIKIIENGQLIIIRNGEKFNAQGVRF